MEKKKKSNPELEELKNKCEEYLSGWKRAMADYQNLQKDTAVQKAELIKSANVGLILALLPLLDNFKMAFKSIPESEVDSAWVVGFSHIKKQLETLLSDYGVESVLTEGQKFNILEHEAVGTETIEDKDDQVVLSETKPGYKLNGRVIQVAKVIVNHLKDNQPSGASNQ